MTRAKTASSRSALVSSENEDSIFARAAQARRSRKPCEANSRSSVSASLGGLFGGTRRPSTPDSISSGIPDTGVETTGTPLAIASSKTFGMPSRSPLEAMTQGSAKTAARW